MLGPRPLPAVSAVVVGQPAAGCVGALRTMTSMQAYRSRFQMTGGAHERRADQGHQGIPARSWTGPELSVNDCGAIGRVLDHFANGECLRRTATSSSGRAPHPTHRSSNDTGETPDAGEDVQKLIGPWLIDR